MAASRLFWSGLWLPGCMRAATFKLENIRRLLVSMGPDSPWDSQGRIFSPNRRFSTHLASNLMFLAGPDFGRDLTSPVAAIQLAAGAFFSVKMTIWDLTSPVAAIQLAAGAFFLGIQPPDYF